MEQDYTKTINAFFAWVYGYIDNIKDLYEKDEEKKSIYKTEQQIKRVESLVMKLIETRKTKPYDARILNDLVWEITTGEYTALAFMKPGSVDNSALVAYRDVLRGIGEYYSLPVQQKEKLLRPIKKWYYVTSTNKLKNLIYPFMPLNHFVLEDKTK